MPGVDVDQEEILNGNTKVSAEISLAQSDVIA